MDPIFLALQQKDALDCSWHIYTTTGTITPSVRQEVAESWIRCKYQAINPYIFRLKKVDENTMKEELALNSNLIQTSRSIMENLLNFVKGTGFLISLANSKGVILDILGEYPILKKAAVQVGHVWSEESTGTNSIGMCVATKKPIQVFASEHFLKPIHGWTSSSSPIFNEDQNMLGVLTMTGEYDKVHLHTLGMVVAGANAIENNLRMQKLLNKAIISDTYKTAIMESIDEGILALNTDGTIRHINAIAKRIMKTKQPDAAIIGTHIGMLIDMSHPFRAKLSTNCSRIFREETFFVDEGSITATTKIIRSPDNNVAGLLIILREMKTVKSLVNRVVGARASLTFHDIIGRNDHLLSAVKLARIAANSVSRVLIMGESGTGKEIFAQAIHNASSRESGPFLGINCAAMPRGLIESELFGYAEGAFTGAKKGGKPGKFELADGGTLFLDEIGEMPLDVQAILLRVLQENSIVRIGGREIIPIDVRIIAATNKNLLEQIEMGHFRNDLFYRLNVLTITIPPLRERVDDIPILSYHFLDKANQRLGKNISVISDQALRLFHDYNWPGNARELQNIIERSANITNGNTVFPSSLPDYILNTTKINRGNYTIPLSDLLSIKEYEKQVIVSLLRKHQGNRVKVAKYLEISRTTLYRKLKEYNITST